MVDAMKTPFVAHSSSILVVHARDEVVALCKSAAPSLGMPVRSVAEMDDAADVVRDTRPLVLVCDAASGISDASVAADLAAAVDAVVVQVDADEAAAALVIKLQAACVQAEKKRAERRG
jgi:hypothetical protein